MRVKFLKHVSTKTRPEDQQHFKEGQEVDLPEASAQHWINRGVAEEVKSVKSAPPSPHAKPAETK